MTNNDQAIEAKQISVITPEDLLEHWQGHRRLTRRLIEAFPEEKLFNYSIGGMRPFSEMILEFLGMTIPGVKGVVTGEWLKAEDRLHRSNAPKPASKAELLNMWDETTEQLNGLWPQIHAKRFQEHDRAFGQWEGPVHFFIFYWIDNEIHHRGQAYVYLRSLGIEPPAFWDRS